MTNDTADPVTPEAGTSPDSAAAPMPQAPTPRARSWEPTPTFLKGALAIALAVIIGGIGYGLGRAAGPDGWPAAPAGWRGADEDHPGRPGDGQGRKERSDKDRDKDRDRDKDGHRQDAKPGDGPWHPGNGHSPGWDGTIDSPVRGTVVSMTGDRLTLKSRGGILEIIVSTETTFHRLDATGPSAASASDVVPNARVWVVVEQFAAGDSIAVPSAISVTILP